MKTFSPPGIAYYLIRVPKTLSHKGVQYEERKGTIFVSLSTADSF